jgi:hypothetical protein
MQEIFGQIVAQWGLVGVLGIAAGWIIYDSFKKNKEMEKYYREKMDEKNELISQMRGDYTPDNNLINRMDTILSRMDELEAKFDSTHPNFVEEEISKLTAIANIAPIIHSVLNSSIADIKADHMLVGLLHNGTHTITGTPFMKFDIVAEKFFPVRNPQDDELSGIYKDHDLMQHNRLPAVVLQGEARVFDIDAGELKDIDPYLNSKLVKRGVKYIAFDIFRDANGLPNGFVCVYSFGDRIVIPELEEATNTIGVTYRSI